MNLLKNCNGTLLAGALALLVGGMVLLGWALDIAALKSVLPGWVSMKPNTAVAFILTGIALLLSSCWPSTLLSRLSRCCVLFAGLIGLLSLGEYASGWNPGFDQWLFPEPTGAVGTSNPGRMAPDTAICFMLFAAGWEFARRPRPTNRTRIATLLLGTAMIIVALVEILSYFTPVLRTYGWGGLTMMALPTATVFAALGAALLLTAWPKTSPKSAAPVAGGSWLFLLIFFLLAAGIIATGIFYYRNYERNFRAAVERQLSAIADLKVSELTQWREDRRSDAAIFFKNPSFTALVRRYFDQPADADARRQLLDWLSKYSTLEDYDRVRLLDPQGGVRLSVPADPEPTGPATLRVATEALQSGEIILKDFDRHKNNSRPYLAILVPMLDEANANRPLGVLVLRIDPAKYLYPFIRRWPTPSVTAETQLIRREGNEMVFLNDLRFQTNSALNLRKPLDGVASPAAQAALGREGVMDGIDYRGVPVVAAMRTVPNSPWALVARMDTTEVYSPLRAL